MHPSTASSTRRAFLRSSGATIALPFLESLGLGAPANIAPPKRLVFLGMGYGVTADVWYPSREQTGTSYDMPAVLAPLERHRQGISIVQNLQHKYSNDGHWGSTFWLTGANRYAIPGQSFHNTVSADQVAAEAWGSETRFTSLQLDSAQRGDGHGPGSSLSWNRSGKSLAALTTPVSAFHKLFSSDSMPLAERQHLLRDQRSVLDTVLSDAKSVHSKLDQHDRDKLGEYLESVREIETRLAKEESWLGVPKKRPTEKLEEPGETLEGVPAVEMMYDIMLAAMQVDATRVFTYRMPGETFISSLGAQIGIHSMSHYSAGERRTVSEKRDRTHARLLARFLDKLKATPEADGSSLFDQVALTFGSNLSSVHHLKNCPTIVAGGGAGFRQGQHIVLDDPKTPLNNLWLTTLQGAGIQAASHGDSTGTIKELAGA